MKVLMLNGSAHSNGNTAIALKEMEQVFAKEGIETELVTIGNQNIRGCIECRACAATGRCVFEDADGLVVGSPVFYASANSTLVGFLTRLFFSTHFSKTMKVGAAVAVARRGGLTSTYDELNKFFAISGMPIATGQYWNGVHGAAPGEAAEDREGLQQMRTLAANMAFLMKCIADGKEKYGLPVKEDPDFMNFIR